MTSGDTNHPAKRLEDDFQTQVIANPTATAILYQLPSDPCQWSTMTYSDLNLWANTIASQIIVQVENSFSKEVPFVALCLSTGPHQLASILGTLKSGHAYVPIDPTCSASRLNFILQDTAVRCVLTESKLMPSLNAIIDEGRLAGIRFILVDNLVDTLDDSLTVRLSESKPSPIAYMIYTSGSSGSLKLFLFGPMNLEIMRPDIFLCRMLFRAPKGRCRISSGHSELSRAEQYCFASKEI